MDTLILTHADCDGLCSGALALSVFRGAKVVFSNPVGLIEDLKYAGEYDRVIVCDVAIDIGLAPVIRKTIDSLAADKEIMYIDHHPLSPRFQASWLVHDTNSCGSLLTFASFRRAVDPDMSRVAMYGAIGDFRDGAPLAEALASRWDKRSLYYEAGTLSQGIEIERRSYGYKRMIVEQLSKNVLPSEIDGLATKAVIASRLEEGLRERVELTVERMQHLAYVVDPGGFISKAAIYARIYGDRPVGISAEYRNEKHAYDLSARSVAGINLNVLLNEAATRYGGHGGGHPMAGGGRIPARNLKKFLKHLDELLRRKLAQKE